MKNNLTCEVVEDLMPSYIDGLTSDVTNKAVREHLSQCGKCNAKLDNMAEPCGEDKIEEEKKEIDFLKKNRIKNIRTKLISVIAVILVVSFIICILPYTERGHFTEDEVLYNLEVDSDKFIFTAIPTTNEEVITYIRPAIDKDGESLDINIGRRKASPFDNRESVTQEISYSNVKRIKILGKIIWEDGEHISDITSEVFAEKQRYVGYVAGLIDIATTLGIYEYVGNLEHSLQTIEEPYVWKMTLYDRFLPEQVKEKESLMQKYAYVLLASVENLGEVTFEYEIFNSDGADKKCKLATTRKQADKYFGDSISKCYDDINELQKLMRMTGLADLPYAQQGDRWSFSSDSWNRIYFRIFNNSESDIKAIDMTWLEGDNFSMGYGIERDFLSFGKSKVNPGTYDFSLDELSSNLYDEKRLGTTEFQISVYDFDGNEYILDEPVEVSAQFGAVYYLVLDGTFEDGFTVKIK